MSYLPILRLAAPETIVALTAFIVLAADLFGMRGLELRFRLLIGTMISCLGCVLAIGWMLVLPQHDNLMKGLLVVDPLTQLVKVGLLVLTIFTLLISVERTFSNHAGEYCALLLLATCGMMFLVSSEDILMLFLALELTSLSLYILTAFDKEALQSAEAALKYFLFGGMSAAFTLFGLSLLYGLSGATNLGEIAAALRGLKLDPVLILALVMVVIGFGFKIAAAPFHLWAPDVYQGAPLPSAAFIASGSKVASFFIFAKVMMVGFSGAEGNGAWRNFAQGWIPVVAIVAACSMVLGNLAAIVQTSLRRLLAYSAIAHAGYMLLGVLSHSGFSLAALIYYVITYGLTTLGAFGVVSVIQGSSANEQLSDLAGLGRRAPILSLCMMVFMLSLAGIPPLAGFFGKFYLFASALENGAPNLGLLWLVILALMMSAVSLYYYLQVLRQIFVAEPQPGVSTARLPALTQLFVSLLAFGVILLGCAPNLLIGPLVQAIKAVGL